MVLLNGFKLWKVPIRVNCFKIQKYYCNLKKKKKLYNFAVTINNQHFYNFLMLYYCVIIFHYEKYINTLHIYTYSLNWLAKRQISNHCFYSFSIVSINSAYQASSSPYRQLVNGRHEIGELESDSCWLVSHLLPSECSILTQNFSSVIFWEIHFDLPGGNQVFFIT